MENSTMIRVQRRVYQGVNAVPDRRSIHCHRNYAVLIAKCLGLITFITYTLKEGLKWEKIKFETKLRDDI